ncbi:hypothetical protein K227x_03350 [Rubripirellula lacrimiformis]|uniref:Uncharacterized protein n=1 Tax=Rubripirellula lacrimiformis TaxID=1930273 RepID=A0A517N4A1_9BACT|nr:hypothetical protein [Rubripirellula lacrimiformis]QDT01965.1 hypothetical protein K227x_03350 [Rubripirellula lacrimiformis]
MTILVKRLPGTTRACHCWFRVQPGQPLDVTFHLVDTSRNSINWAGQQPRFRVYSQTIDQLVVLEVTDSHTCNFQPGGLWRLQLSAQQTSALPRGGMRFTLEHRHADGDFVFGLLGGVSCSDAPANCDHNRIAKLLPH